MREWSAIRSVGEGRPSWDSGWWEDMLEEMLEVEGGQGYHQRLQSRGQADTRGQEQMRTVFQEQNQMQRVSFTIAVSTFRLPKIPFTDGMSLIKRMSPVLPG